MVLDFFNQRKHVRIGGEAALQAVWGHTRPFETTDREFGLESEAFYRNYLRAPAPATVDGDSDPNPKDESPLGAIHRARAKYYAELPARLWVAREFAMRGGFGSDDSEGESWIPSWLSSYFSSSPSDSHSSSDTPSSSDPAIPPAFTLAWSTARSQFPTKLPPSEVELRMERFEKEKRWRADAEGWEVVRPEAGVMWVPELGEGEGGVLRVFVDGEKEGKESKVY